MPIAWFLEPLVAKDGIQVFARPPSLEPRVLHEGALPAHAQPLEQREGRLVLLVRDGEDPVQPEVSERVIQQTRDRFRGVTLPLMLAGEREADLGLPAILLDLKGAVPDKGVRLF